MRLQLRIYTAHRIFGNSFKLHSLKARTILKEFLNITFSVNPLLSSHSYDYLCKLFCFPPRDNRNMNWLYISHHSVARSNFFDCLSARTV